MPMRILRSRLLAPLMFLAPLACGSDADEAGAARLWRAIHDDDYRSWEPAPGWETPEPTIRPHGDTALIYFNPVRAGAAAQDTPLDAWPEGAILVKDGFRGDQRSLIAAMEKRSNGWFFAEWDGDGDVLFAGRPDVCVNCHQSGADFVFAAALP
jgi:hypothetical protein